MLDGFKGGIKVKVNGKKVVLTDGAVIFNNDNKIIKVDF